VQAKSNHKLEAARVQRTIHHNHETEWRKKWRELRAAKDVGYPPVELILNGLDRLESKELIMGWLSWPN
jgi:hypothetical protein